MKEITLRGKKGFFLSETEKALFDIGLKQLYESHIPSLVGDVSDE